MVVVGIAAGLLHTGDSPADSGFLRDKNNCAQGTCLRGHRVVSRNLAINTTDTTSWPIVFHVRNEFDRFRREKSNYVGQTVTSQVTGLL